MKTIIVAILAALLLTACAVMTNPKDSQTVIYSTICVLGMCESADEIDRVGDPQAGGDVDEAVEENTDTDQGQEGELSVSLPGGGILPEGI